MKIYLSILLFLFCKYSGLSQSFEAVSKKISAFGKSSKSKWKGETFYDVRMKLFHTGRINFINYSSDTLFLLESYDIESGTYMGMIWNSKDELNYKYYKGNFEFNSKRNFTNHEIDLVRQWNTIAIRKEQENGDNQLHERWIKGIMVKKLRGKSEVQCLSFEEF